MTVLYSSLHAVASLHVSNASFSFTDPSLEFPVQEEQLMMTDSKENIVQDGAKLSSVKHNALRLPTSMSKPRMRRIGKYYRSLTGLQLPVTAVDHRSENNMVSLFEQVMELRPCRESSTPAFEKIRKTKSVPSICQQEQTDLINHSSKDGTWPEESRCNTASKQTLRERHRSLDISGQTGDIRYPWLRDVGIQTHCDEFQDSNGQVSHTITMG